MKDLNEFVEPLLREAGDLALRIFRSSYKVASKTHAKDVVTDADHAVSDFLIDRLTAEFPEYGIVSEERPDIINADHSLHWVIDPIDGTLEFANGNPSWCILLALADSEKAVFGAAFAPVSDTYYHSTRGEGAYRNGNRLKVAEATSFKRAILAAQCAVDGHNGEDYLDVTYHIMKEGAWTASQLSMLNCCYLASGTFDIDLLNGGKEWDYLAPFLFAEEAGALVTDSYGRPWHRSMKEAVVANPVLHAKAIKMFEDVRARR
jgi:myo-inositol-1(or 4)-monophosphatase